ncbi:hypothetical protein [Chitinophaga ginsengisoli]|uniref:Uncharacterized protein n=1 Tax=Chitinophaga ginsengisoli TaxID=363837 RepID=A0A2P8G4W6_9BACT|nr:hypothetical protein [Chitinophaga ginsengisoli]PSL29018.1 hypothetical protein CLV42_107164 [Chitinophaga ginsengisoli]
MNIIVPINVEVLRVSPSPAASATPQSVKSALYDFSQAGAHALAGTGSLIAANNFEHAEELINNKPGLHVHWSLPAAYTHGVQDNASGALRFPALPNRWLVIRFFKNRNGQENTDCIKDPANFSPSLQIWILESDAHAAPGTTGFDNGTDIPWMNDTQNLSAVSYRKTGRKITLGNGWTEPSGNNGPGIAFLGDLLQAPMAYGETFTAYYQNCGNIFGIYDDLSDLFQSPACLEMNSNFSVSYAVMGWVSPLENDTCSKILDNALTAYHQMPVDKQPVFTDYIQQIFEQQLKWNLSDYTTFTADNTSQTQGILSGIAANINWNITQPGAPSYPDVLPDTSNVRTAIGNNNVEALSAYLNALSQNKATNDPDDVTTNTEWLLNALQFGQLPNIGRGELGVGQLDEYLHAKTFGSHPGGFIWTVRNIMTSKAAPRQDVEVTLLLPLAKMLSQLNSSQYTYDNRLDEISGRRKKLFLDWCYHINAIENNVINASGNINDDLSGAFLIEGLMHLFPVMLQAGAASEIAGPHASSPYNYKPAAFTIQAPEDIDPHLQDYVFNEGANLVAATTIKQLLDLSYSLEGLIPDHIRALQQSLETTLLSLNAAQPGGSDAGSYLAQAISALQSALSTAQLLHGEFAKTANMPPLQNAISNDLKSLNDLIDPNTGIFSQIKITNAIQPVPLPAGMVYTGEMASLADYANAGSWTPQDQFPGMKVLIDTCSGQEDASYHISDIQASGVYLATAYFWRISGQTANHTTAYYIQMAQQEIADAIQNGENASTALQNAISLVAVNNGTVQQVGQAILTILDTTIPTLLNFLQAKEPDITSAIALLQQLNINGLQAACKTPDWLNFVSSIEQAWLLLLSRLPDAQQVDILSNYLYKQVNTHYVLGTTPAGNFWHPHEPVILLAENGNTGNVIKSINRNGPSSLLPCRLENELVNTNTTYPATISKLANTVNPGITGLSSLLQQLAAEAVLLCPELETVVGADVLATAAVQNETLHYNKQHQVTLNPAPTGFNGKLPYYIGWNWSDGKDPFLPLYIFWSAEYVYSQQLNFDTAQLPPDYLQSEFTLDQYLTDNQLQATAADNFKKNTSKPNFFSMSGVISLSGAATANLCEQIRNYCVQNLDYDPAKGAPDSNDPFIRQEEERFYKAYSEYKTMHVLSQGLSGFNAAMFQRAQELQLPLNIPASWTTNNKMPVSDFWPTQMLFTQSQDWPLQWAADSINNNAFSQGAAAVYFNPLRAGLLNIGTVTLVDVFGRFVNIISNNIGQQPIVAEALQVQIENPLPDHPIYLPPRLVQPSRLLFKWIAAGSPDTMQHFTEWNPHPAASPVCGWMLPDHLDQSLALYNSDGAPLGALRSIDTGMHWFTVPGESYPAGIPNRQLMINDLQDRGANPLLQSFLETFAFPDVTAPAATDFTRFLQVLDAAQQFIITPSMQQDRALAVLTGQPLALVQAVIRLETMGLADTSADDKSYIPWNTPGAQFQLDQNGFIPYNFNNFNNAALNDLAIPLKLGVLEYEKNGQLSPYFDDGLVGFFLGNDFSVFYTPVKLSDNTMRITSTSLPGATPAVLQPDGKPVTITMIIDPRAAVHATTGVLPIQDLKVPDDQYSRAISSLRLTFLTGPVLRTAAPIRIPAPAETGYSWSWQQVGTTNEPLQPAQLNTDAVFPASPQFIVDGWMNLKHSK